MNHRSPLTGSRNLLLAQYAIVRFIPCPASSAHDVSHRRLYADSDDWLDGMQKPLVGVGADGRRLAETNVTYCGTDVIGDVTPFSLTYPYPFFLDTQYFVNGTYALSASDSGTIIIQGLLLASAPPILPHIPIISSLSAANLPHASPI